MKTKKYLLLFISFLFSLTQCIEAPDWNDETYDSVPPGKILSPIVENINGGAIITYTLPTDNDLLAVKAIYSYTEGGETMEAYSSAFTNSIRLVGFPDTKQRKILLIAMDKSNNESSPVEVTIQPSTPPIQLIRNSLIVHETFSGIFVKWENDTKADIGISLFVEDSLGFMNLDYTYFTSESGNYSFRGYQNKERKFRILLKDRWNNTAIPLDTLLTPLYEEDVVARLSNGRTSWIRYGYVDQTTLWRGDYPGQFGASEFSRMFDGATGSSNYFHPGLTTTYDLQKFTNNPEHKGILKRPMYLTIDMTRESKLSRYKVYFRSGNINANDPYYLVIWASNETPKGPNDFGDDKTASLAYWTAWEEVNGKDSWKNDWKQIGECLVIPPSGATEQFQWTSEDLAWAQAGIEFDFDPTYSNTPFRYLRIECFDNIKKTELIHFVEWEIYGSAVNK